MKNLAYIALALLIMLASCQAGIASLPGGPELLGS